MAARFPGRVGLGVASGALPDDFDIMHVPMDDLATRFTSALEELAGMLDGSAPGRLAGDAAVAACAERPVPVLSAAMGFTAVRRAARLGAGLAVRLAVGARALPRADRRLPRPTAARARAC